MKSSQVLYLGISGVLHPSWSFYEEVNGHPPDQDGHKKYESVGPLYRALEAFPEARIVLTSTQPWAKGLPTVLEQLGQLAERVDGFTFLDLTTKAPCDRLGRPMTEMDYWRCTKSQVVQRHVEWIKPESWIAIDDEDILWPHDVRAARLVLTDPCQGLSDPRAFDRLLTVLEGNFGGG
ncbi:HAD domain-containing protein [Paludibacterium sp.]|uniref:HAD domain-containing protein n=1 Tax=Paludibacterium sp. TaxID=1917523 RepID=UPI0025E9E643|nr:HAD domain-containing protein [Paludibacterium sp.]MBV8646332.1 hypothetical protein [Paludibacterium sp.]